jgi:beta-phosphoglucomutase
MDGVIIDSTETHTEAWRQYLSGHQIEFTDVGARMLGKHNPDLVRDFFFDRDLTDDLINYHGTQKEALYRELMTSMLQEKLVPGAVEFIRQHGSVPKAVATNAEAPNVSFVLEGAGIADCFSVIVNGYEVARPKPAPDVYLRAAELLGVTPQNCIVFEDSPTGVQAARAGGMHVVGLTTTMSELKDVDLEILNFADSRLEPWIHSLAQR